MKKIAFLLLLFSGLISAQVGINTTTPSAASVLHLESLNGSGTHGGFMPPKVTLTQRGLIPVTASDDGMMIFLSDGTTRCVQVYDGVNSTWVNFYCIPVPFSEIGQDFDAITSWSYVVSPVTYNVSGDVWAQVNSLGTITTMSNNFWGCQDLENGNGGGTQYHEMAFVNVDVSAATNPKIAFDYEYDLFDNGDAIRYEVFVDDVSIGTTYLLTLTNIGSASGTEVINIPGGASNVRITIGIKQNGGSDYAGFDNFRVYE